MTTDLKSHGTPKGSSNGEGQATENQLLTPPIRVDSRPFVVLNCMNTLNHPRQAQLLAFADWSLS
jgi:hypothetical protein